MTIANFVIVMIDEARDSAVGTHGPARQRVKQDDSIEVERISPPPVNAMVITQFFPGGPDREKYVVINNNYR